MNEFNTDNRFCLIAGPGAAGKIDSFDDGNPNDGAFQRHPKSEKGADYIQDIYCAYFDHPDFGIFQENLLDPEGFFTRWRTPEKETDPKAADMLDLLDNVENPEKLVIRLPANPLSTLPWLQWIFKNDVTGDEETYPGTETHKIRMEFDRYDLPGYLPEQLEIYHGDMESKFADNVTIGPEYLYRTGYFNLYDLREQQIEREASKESPVETEPGRVAAADVEIVEEMDPADVEEPVTVEVEPGIELIPLNTLFSSRRSYKFYTGFYSPLEDVEKEFSEIIDSLKDPQFEDSAHIFVEVWEDFIATQMRAMDLKTELDELAKQASESPNSVFGGKRNKTTFILRCLTIAKIIEKELGIPVQTEAQRDETPPPAISDYLKIELKDVVGNGHDDGEIYLASVRVGNNDQRLIRRFYFDEGDGRLADIKLRLKDEQELMQTLGLPLELVPSLRGLPVRAVQDYLSALKKDYSIFLAYNHAIDHEPAEGHPAKERPSADTKPSRVEQGEAEEEEAQEEEAQVAIGVLQIGDTTIRFKRYEGDLFEEEGGLIIQQVAVPEKDLPMKEESRIIKQLSKRATALYEELASKYGIETRFVLKIKMADNGKDLKIILEVSPIALPTLPTGAADELKNGIKRMCQSYNFPLYKYVLEINFP